jgi:hypothetical protein
MTAADAGMKFELGPNGGEVKDFLTDRSDADALASTYSDRLGENFTVVQGRAPQSVMDGAERFPFSDVPGRPMEGVAVRGQDNLDQICDVSVCQ